MDMNNSLLNSNYTDDLIDQMEKGELTNEYLLDDSSQHLTLNQKIVNTSKRFFNISTKFYRQKSDTSIDMSFSSETSNDSGSGSVSPFLDDNDHFYWELPEHDYDSKIDDSNLEEFYGEYRSFILENVPKNSKSKRTTLSTNNPSKMNENSNPFLKTNKNNQGLLGSRNNIRKAKYHSFKQFSNSL